MREANGPFFRRIWFGATHCGILLLAACVPNHRAAAERTLQAYTRAVAHNDPSGAYRLLSPSLRRQLVFEDFLAQWQTQQTDLQEQARQIQTALRTKDLRELATVDFPQTALAEFSAQPGLVKTTWLLSRAQFHAAPAATPLDVVRLLIGAAEQRHFPAGARLFSTAQRQALEAQIDERTQRLRAALADPKLEIHGDRARLQYDPRFFIEFQREGDSWRIVDLN